MDQTPRIHRAGSILIFLLASAVPTLATNPAELKDQVDAYVRAHQKEIMEELVELLSIPDVAADRENIRLKAERLREMLAARGFSAELLETEGNPLVYGELRSPGAEGTLLLYCHYDGQPVDPSRWEQENPFQPVLRDGKLEDGARDIDFVGTTQFEPDWRLYARSASDDTSPIVALLVALDAIRASDKQPTSNLRVILDGEEEAGSPSLTPAIDRYRDKLEADLMLILDGPNHPSGRPTLVFGARGILSLELTVYGPKFPLHSGHYGNWAPNPAMRLAQLLASMKNDDGRVTIEGFYGGIEIPDEDRRAMDSVPDDHEALMELFGFAQPDAVGRSLQEAIQYPSLNIRGLSSAWVGGEARTIIPDRAVAAIDIRLVAETSGERLYEKVQGHIEGEGYLVVAEDPDDATRARHPKIVKVAWAVAEAYRTPLNDPQAERLTGSLTRTWGQEPVRIRTSGGTVPISPFIQALGFPAIGVPIVNFDNNQHSPNENLRLGHFFDGIVTIAALLAR
jgi:acetylornithine deacetylase/succinyl-diaminopimelate desuccinylase-like protein